MASKPGATATVIVTMEIHTGGSSWGDDCTVAQVHRQAKDQTYGFIQKLRHEHPNEIVSYTIDKIKIITSERDA